jgi:hypothetical protein
LYKEANIGDPSSNNVLYTRLQGVDEDGAAVEGDEDDEDADDAHSRGGGVHQR